MYNIKDIIAKKRDGIELHWEEIEYFIEGSVNNTVNEAQIGALLMGCHIHGLSDTEMELLMRAMMFSGQLLVWPAHWNGKMASLQSLGSAGNKAKLVLAPVMAACGLKFPILSSAGTDMVGAILSKLSTIPGFSGSDKTLEDVQTLLSEVGCCVVEQPKEVAPGERIIRDMANTISIGNCNAFKEVCMMARVAALKLCAIVLDIPYGPGCYVKTKHEAVDMAKKLNRLSKVMCLKYHVVISALDHPIGEMIGQTLEIVEAIKCLHGEAHSDLQQLVCKLGSHILLEAGVVDNLACGAKVVGEKLKDGSARKKFGQMLHAQGVKKSDVKELLRQKHDNFEHIWCVLPKARLFTHLSVSETGFVHGIDVAACHEVMFEILKPREQDKPSAGGLQLLTSVGSYLNRGELWAKVHHNLGALTEDHIHRLKNTITLKLEPPVVDMIVETEAITDM